MKRIVVTIALLVCGSATAATLPQVPAVDGRLGDLDQSAFQCRKVDNGVECRREGRPTDRIAKEPVMTMVLLYRDEALVRSVYAFTEEHFDELVGRLTDQLGNPKSGSEGLIAGMGGVFQNRHYVWKLDGRVWFVEQYFERIATSGLWVMDDAEFAALQAERESMRFRGARNL